jgi:uncharacterized protein YkwD
MLRSLSLSLSLSLSSVNTGSTKAPSPDLQTDDSDSDNDSDSVRRYRWVGVLAFLLLGCASPNARMPERPSAPMPELDSLQLAVLSEVNSARRRFGTGTLVDDPGLTRAAVLYSAELALRGRLDHFSSVPFRQTLRDRLRAERVSFSAAGENLARLGLGKELVPRQVVTSWLNSPAHKHTMLDWRFSRSGIGITRDADGLWYIVQVLAAPQ